MHFYSWFVHWRSHCPKSSRLYVETEILRANIQTKCWLLVMLKPTVIMQCFTGARLRWMWSVCDHELKWVWHHCFRLRLVSASCLCVCIYIFHSCTKLMIAWGLVRALKVQCDRFRWFYLQNMAEVNYNMHTYVFI